ERGSALRAASSYSGAYPQGSLSVSTDGGHTEGRPGGRGEGYRGHSYASYTRGAEQYGVSVKQHTHTHTHTHTHIHTHIHSHTCSANASLPLNSTAKKVLPYPPLSTLSTPGMSRQIILIKVYEKRQAGEL